MGAPVALLQGAGGDHDHVEAAPGQGQRTALPDAAAGPGDQGDPALGGIGHGGCCCLHQTGDLVAAVHMDHLLR